MIKRCVQCTACRIKGHGRLKEYGCLMSPLAVLDVSPVSQPIAKQERNLGDFEMASCPLKVAVRIRPPQPHDGKVGNIKSVQVIDAVTLEANDGADSKQFVYDRVFGPVCTSDVCWQVCEVQTEHISTKSTELELRGWCYEPTTLHHQERFSMPRKPHNRRCTVHVLLKWWML